MSTETSINPNDIASIREEVRQAAIATEQAKLQFNKLWVAWEFAEFFLENLAEEGKPPKPTAERNIFDYIPEMVMDHIGEVKGPLDDAGERLYELHHALKENAEL